MDGGWNWMDVFFFLLSLEVSSIFFKHIFFLQIIDSSLYLNFWLKIIFGIHIFFLRVFTKVEHQILMRSP